MPIGSPSMADSGRPANARVLETADADGIYRLLAERLALLP